MPDAALDTTTAPRRPAWLNWRFLLRFQGYFGLIAILVIAALLSPERDGQNVFLDSRNLLNIIRFSSVNGIIAIGMTLVILTAGIDLSVGAVLALCAVGSATSMMHYGFDLPITILFVLTIGTTAGFINGFVTTQLRLQSFITTLAMLSVTRGVASLWADGYAIPISYGEGPDLAPPIYRDLFAGQIMLFGLEVPVGVFYFLGIAMIASFVLARTRFGRHVYAVGGNETAARLSGVNVNAVRIAVFTITGLLVGFASLLHSALVSQGSHIDGQGYVAERDCRGGDRRHQSSPPRLPVGEVQLGLNQTWLSVTPARSHHPLPTRHPQLLQSCIQSSRRMGYRSLVSRPRAIPLSLPARDLQGATVFRLDDKTALVTGAGSGIGRGIALLFARQGAHVAVADINDDGASDVVSEISSAGGGAFAVHLDVSDRDSAAAAVSMAVETTGKLDILVNNAGIGMVGSLTETEPADFDRLMAVNVNGIYFCSQAAVNQMLAQSPQGGAIINIASIAGQVAVARRFAYGTTKGAVISMTQSIAMDYIDRGIRCNCICPGTVESPFVEAYLQTYHAGEVEETRVQLHARQPLGRMGRPEEIAPLALYLASDESAYVTGSQMTIDGGLTAR